MDRVKEISQKLNEVIELINKSMLEFLFENDFEVDFSDKPIMIFNEEDYESHGVVYKVFIEEDPIDGAPNVAFKTSYGFYNCSEDEMDIEYISDINIQDLKYIYERMIESKKELS